MNGASKKKKEKLRWMWGKEYGCKGNIILGVRKKQIGWVWVYRI